MANISKLQREAKAARQASAEKAKAALIGGFSKLIEKHIENFIRAGVEVDGTVTIKVNELGKTAMRITYSTVISEGVAFELDDGQADLIPPEGGEAGQPQD